MQCRSSCGGLQPLACGTTCSRASSFISVVLSRSCRGVSCAACRNSATAGTQSLVLLSGRMQHGLRQGQRSAAAAPASFGTNTVPTKAASCISGMASGSAKMPSASRADAPGSTVTLPDARAAVSNRATKTSMTLKMEGVKKERYCDTTLKCRCERRTTTADQRARNRG